MLSAKLPTDPLSILLDAIICVAVASTLAVLYSYASMLLLRRKLPPGPFPLPIVGNMLSLPKSKPWRDFEHWSEKYGSGLLTIWIGRVPNIFVNDAWVASDLLEKKASIYSSRPRQVVMGDVTGIGKNNQVLLKYNDHWRLHRKLMHGAVGSQAVRQYRGFQNDEISLLISDLASSSEDFSLSIERFSCSIVSILGWGRRIAKKNDYIVGLALQMMETVTHMQVPGAYWMEAIPELQYLPHWLYPLPTTLRTMGAALRRYWFALTEEGAFASEPNFAKSLIESRSELSVVNDDISEMTANLIGGGVDTTTGTTLSAILGLVTHPEVQKKAHEEIDSIVGKDRVPTWDDVEKMPYCAAILKETLRWRSVTILGGLPHAPIQDDVYKGYLIPKDIAIHGNLWAIHRNPRDFPEPDQFNPDRYMNKESLNYPNTRGHNAFGWGRRICSGQPLAEQGISMVIVKLMWAFNIKPGLDEQGVEVMPDIFAFTDAENSRPQPFKARFEPRSESIRKLVFEEADAANERLRKWDGETKVTVEQFLADGV
ncbi:cytochrome P450 [Cadophora sp. MPI-SDFR-AT-0126]|nr:cytochrome P450 [Leotiomycetes sp. MPI-SDFR-AT-0126]